MTAADATTLTVDRTARFPGLVRPGPDGRRYVHADAPGGTQVVDTVAHAMNEFLTTISSNPNRVFPIAVQTGEVIDDVRRTCSELLEVPADGVVFGSSTTALVWKFARAFAPTLRDGDNIVCTQLDHDANVAPWLTIAAERGADVRFVPLDAETYDLNYSALEQIVDRRTKLIAFTRTSNLLGTVVPEQPFVDAALAVGAITFTDGVAAAAHHALALATHGIDVGVCSAYKFFGPHVAILAAQPDLLERLVPDRLRPSPSSGPRRWEQGMLASELVVGLGAAARYVLEVGYPVIESIEQALTQRMLDGLTRLPQYQLHGVVGVERRDPTFALTTNRATPHQLAVALSARGIFASAGHNYALECIRALGREDQGVLRLGLVHYHQAEDVDRILEALAAIAS